MATDDPEAPARSRPTVFLSYASEDRRAAQRIRDALPTFGMEAWYDESELVGGDAWDQKIRRQIRECDYFMPVISAHTDARHEGYFRREWRLAVERTLDMADDHVFLLPVVIDATTDSGARVPDKFRAVQWLRLPDGQPTAALESVCRRLVSGRAGKPPSQRSPEPSPKPAPPRPAVGEFPPFPHEEPGQKTRFWFQVAGWALQYAWTAFKRLPRWLRILIYIWAVLFVLAKGCTPPHVADNSPPPPPPPHISAAQAAKLKEIGASHPGTWTTADTVQLLAQIAKEIPAEAADNSSHYAPVLAIPFAAPSGDAAAQKLAGSVFAQVYGRLSIARHGHATLADQPLAGFDAAAATSALAQGRARGATYVVYGAVTGGAAEQQLTIKIVETDNGTVLWSQSYAVAGADPADIAAKVSANVPRGGADDD